MPLDVSTLYVSTFTVCLLLGAASIAFGAGRPHMRPLLPWGAGLISIAAGLMLVALRGQVPATLSVTLGNGLLLAAVLGMEQCARALRQWPRGDYLGWAVLAAYVVALQFWDGFATSRVLHTLVASFLFALLLFRAAYALDRTAPPEEAVLLRVIAFVLCLIGVLIEFSGIWVVVELGADDGPQRQQAAAAVLLAVSSGLLGCTLALLWLMAGRLIREVTQLGTVDSLTGTLNRAAFIERCEQETSRAKRGSALFALAVLDVDHLKQVNDAFGQAKGDAVITALVAAIRKTIRPYDLIGRHGGEEFALLLPGTQMQGALELGERVRCAVERAVMYEAEVATPVTISLGIAMSSDYGMNWEDMFRAAEGAVLEAQRAGCNRVVMARAGAEPGVTAQPLETA